MPKVTKNLLDKQVLSVINDQGVAVMPTDTLYGLVARADFVDAVSRIHELKGRNSKPGTIIASSIEQLAGLGIKRRYLKAVEQFWPNPISVVVPVGNSLPHLHSGEQTTAVRIPNVPALQKLLSQTGPLVTSSANTTGKKPAETIKEATEYFGDEVDIYVDGGSKEGAKPSTIIKIVDDAIEILREGAVTISETGRISK